MRIAEVRHACLVLIQHRLGAETRTTDPQPVALGWHLENSRASAAAMAALCASAMAGAGPARWRPSPALRALLGEYGTVRRAPRIGGRDRRSRQAARGRAADLLH